MMILAEDETLQTKIILRILFSSLTSLHQYIYFHYPEFLYITANFTLGISLPVNSCEFSNKLFCQIYSCSNAFVSLVSQFSFSSSHNIRFGLRVFRPLVLSQLNNSFSQNQYNLVTKIIFHIILNLKLLAFY